MSDTNGLEKRILVLVGFQEKQVMDSMIGYLKDHPKDHFTPETYSGVILTGRDNPRLDSTRGKRRVASDAMVYDELAYMESNIDPRIPIVDRVPSLTLMGNIKNVLDKYPNNVTFLVDESQFHRANDVFLQYFKNRNPDIEDVEVISPERSYRANTQYEIHSKMMDKLYKAALSLPISRNVIEYFSCSNTRLMRHLTGLKNRLIVRKIHS